MPVGLWSGASEVGVVGGGGGSGGGPDWEAWDEPRVVSRDISPEAFMEELCTAGGGYGRFFWTLLLHYLGWWAGIVVVPAIFLDHHRCEARLPYLAWILYGATLAATLAMAVLLELSVVQRLGLLKAGELANLCYERRWRLPLLGTVLWKLDAYTDIVFIFIARDCGSGLWWAALATFVFGVVFGQLLFNTCFACTDCDHELPASFGFMLLDFKLVNAAVRRSLPFDPDASHLPVARPVTLRTTSHIIAIEKILGDIMQVAIQVSFLRGTKVPQGFVLFSVFVGVLHGGLSLCVVLRECVQDEWAVQAQGVQLGTALLPGSQVSGGSLSILECTSPPPSPAAMPSAASGATGEGGSGSGGGASKAPRPSTLGRSSGLSAPSGRGGAAAGGSEAAAHASGSANSSAGGGGGRRGGTQEMPDQHLAARGRGALEMRAQQEWRPQEIPDLL